ncbi:hypothetical protein DWW91_05160 [Parabacteroides sp. AF17-3]|nr:hypothetical protein DWW91_05160 [Parabacteroides sp. AF17-3]
MIKGRRSFAIRLRFLSYFDYFVKNRSLTSLKSLTPIFENASFFEMMRNLFIYNNIRSVLRMKIKHGNLFLLFAPDIFNE